METMIEGLTEGPAAWWLLGAAAVVGIARGGRVLAKGALKGYFATRDRLDRLTTGSRQGMRDLYEEAVAEYQTSTTAPAAARTRARTAGSTRPESARAAS